MHAVNRDDRFGDLIDPGELSRILAIESVGLQRERSRGNRKLGRDDLKRGAIPNTDFNRGLNRGVDAREGSGIDGQRRWRQRRNLVGGAQGHRALEECVAAEIDGKSAVEEQNVGVLGAPERRRDSHGRVDAKAHLLGRIKRRARGVGEKSLERDGARRGVRRGGMNNFRRNGQDTNRTQTCGATADKAVLPAGRSKSHFAAGRIDGMGTKRHSQRFISFSAKPRTPWLNSIMERGALNSYRGRFSGPRYH
jgi:hypothetical protein